MIYHCQKLHAICEKITEYFRLEPQPTPMPNPESQIDNYLKAFCADKTLCVRKVCLKADSLKHDCGVLLCFDATTAEPFLLTPDANGSYISWQYSKNSCLSTTVHDHKKFQPEAYLFSITLENRELNLKGLYRSIHANEKQSLFKIISIQLTISLLLLFIPFISGKVIDLAIITANLDTLHQLILGGFTIILMATALMFTQMFLVIRFKLKCDVTLQTGIWYRLLNLPINFFRQHQVGDMLTRINGIEKIQQLLSLATINAISSGLFSLFAILLIAVYSIKIAAYTLLFCLFSVLIVGILLRFKVDFDRKMLNRFGKLNASVIQALNCIIKLRLANAESGYYAHWKNLLKNYLHEFARSGLLSVWINTFTSFATVASFIFLIILFTNYGSELSVGDFIAVNAAYGSFLAALFMLMETATQLTEVVPLLERIKPILQSYPEPSANKLLLKYFKGKIELRNVSFRYPGSNFLTLQNCNITIEPGMFVALSGCSGCGKTTLMKLILGFEKITAGNILIDGVNIEQLNTIELRKYSGIVMQQCRIYAGSIYENVDLGRNLPQQEVENALKLAAIYDECLQLPMGLKTLLNDNLVTFSQGQKQRICLARALADNPKILLLDEPTSGIDNVTEQRIWDNISKLAATKIVITHRAATLNRADRVIQLRKNQ